MPVQANAMADGVFEVLHCDEFDSEDNSMIFEYGEGDLVRAHLDQIGSGGALCLVANQLIRSASTTNQYKRMLFKILHESPSPESICTEYGKELVRRLLLIRDLKYPALENWVSSHKLSLHQFVD